MAQARAPRRVFETEEKERRQSARGIAEPQAATLSPTAGRLVGGGTGSSPGAGDAAALQRLVGNRTTSELLAVQRVTRPNRRNREGRKARETRQRKESAQAPSWTWGGLASSVWGMVSGGFSGQGDGGSSQVEEESGDELEEEKKDLLEVPKLVIELPEQEFERQLLDGQGKASGSGSGALKAGIDGLEAEGKGELKAQLGFEEGIETGELTYQLAGGELSGKGELKAFFGHRGEASGEASISGEGASAKGKLAAFSGISLDSETEITIKAGERELGKFKGALGAAFGIGGEISGQISFKGGVFKYASKGKVAAGAGFTWGYEFEVNVAPLSTSIFSWLGSLGSAAHDFLTDDDGEPLLL